MGETLQHRGCRHLVIGVLSVGLLGALWSAWSVPLTPREVYQQASPAVVFVLAASKRGRSNGGSGAILHPDGLLITNAHVVINEASDTPHQYIEVYLKPTTLRGKQSQDLQRRYSVHLLAHDTALDIALLQMRKPPPNLSVLVLDEAADFGIGEPVAAIGHPETGGLWTLTTGVISAQLADFQGVSGKDMWQTEASINRGNSGGPLLNRHGAMVGMVSSISRRSTDDLAITDINFALKSSVIRRWLGKQGISLPSEVFSPPPASESTPPPAASPLVSSEPAPALPRVAAEPPSPAPMPPSDNAPPLPPFPETVPRPALRPRGQTPRHPYSLRQRLDRRMQQLEERER
ncbi:MAG: trypsin-like peptidase domain-containing protein [Candidatus Tectomicrobia bacterium]